MSPRIANARNETTEVGTRRATDLDHRLGPCPRRAVSALADLGLADAEIARYFLVDPEAIARLRRRPRQVARG